MTAILETVGRDERFAAGKAIRAVVPRSVHAELPPRPDGFDVIAAIENESAGRLRELVPIRYFRMAEGAFSFYRGTADLMAIDLAATPTTGLRTQLGGDAHCANFGTFATPERNLIFDVRDFDETIPGPWEWDVKRFATSLVLAARDVELKRREADRAVAVAIATYREKTAELAGLSTLDMWYARVDAQKMLDRAGSSAIRQRRRTYMEGTDRRTVQHAYDSMTEVVDGVRRFKDESPLVFHSRDAHELFDIDELFASYRESITDDVRALFDRYRLVDWVVKVVGVGSVGTRCAAALFHADDDCDPLILQMKEANASVLERFVGASRYGHHGQRVVAGQRTMQAASDLFLGWASSLGRDFYVRQLRDMKGVPDLEDMDAEQLVEFARFCGWTLAGAHARGGDAAQIAGYLGRGDAFDSAIVDFANAYADRATADHAALREAIGAGRLEARSA